MCRCTCARRCASGWQRCEEAAEAGQEVGGEGGEEVREEVREEGCEKAAKKATKKVVKKTTKKASKSRQEVLAHGETVSEGDTGPVGKVGGTRAYTGRVISVDVDQVRFPDGSIGSLEMVRHPGASAVVPVIGDMSADPIVLLIRQYRYAAEQYLYEIPAGRLDPGESPEQCAHRELQEETGTRPIRWITCSPCTRRPGSPMRRSICFGQRADGG